jgi:hypothetical protein
MNSFKTSMLALLLILAAGVSPLFGQDLVTKALSSFPADTIRLEYSSPSTLRKLPNYATLQQHYMGPRLKKLVESMAELGIKETDVDQLVLGWSAGSSDLNLYGFAQGNFDPRVLNARAEARNLPAEQIGGKTGYCLGAGLESQCVVILGPGQGVFGTLATLSQITQNLNGGGVTLSTVESFANAVKQQKSSAPIWGVAVASAVASWFSGWMPRQSAVDLDWTKVFQGVNVFGYSINTGNDIQLNLNMYCKTDQDASSLRQVMEGLKLAQQIAWQNQNPNTANPFQNLELSETGSQLSINMVAQYDAVTAGQ